jgi:hypothetical protein
MQIIMTRKFLFILFMFPMVTFGQENFSKYFQKKSLRYDFLLGGNAKEVRVYPQQMKQEPYWGGSTVNLTDTFNYGTYRFQVYDTETEKLLYSKGFSTLFQEWQTTAEAKIADRTFYQAVIFPFPKKKVRLSIEARQWEGNFNSIFETEIDPANYFILKEEPYPYESVSIVSNGKPEEKVDLLILAEGYTTSEINKFVEDAKRVIGYLFEEEPFKSNKERFNVTALLTPSVDSGTDIPGENIYKNTVFNATFYTFDIDRYLTTSDMKTIYDAAASVPYDHIYILVNSERYGGGGFYNFLTVCTADNQLTKEVFVHEFGHGFAGLGDEYYNSSVAYENYYNLEIEPWEPNLTTLVDFEKKWKSMIDPSTPVPTPREAKYSNVVGVFEGGGYMDKGIYSPVIDCRMKSNVAESFCPVCSLAIQRVIDFHCE